MHTRGWLALASSAISIFVHVTAFAADLPPARVGAAATSLCAASVPASAIQSVSSAMTGCGGAVSFATRASLCSASAHACSAAEWLNNRGTFAPVRHYWTSDTLYYFGTGTNTCSVYTVGNNACATSMLVCAQGTGGGPSVDDFGNGCAWFNCAFGSSGSGPNEFFGGCPISDSAGTLCCANALLAAVDVPVDLTVTDVGSTAVSFTWTGTAPEFRAIYKAGSLPASPLDGTVVFEGPAEASPPNTATATALAPNTRYFIAVYGKASGTASYSSSAVSTSIITGPTAKIVLNGAAPPWDRRGSPTRIGKFIYATDTGDLNFFDGNTVQTIQPKGAFTENPNTVFTLGTAAAPAQVIAAWRRGSFDAYLSVDGGSPAAIAATNPVDPAVAMNCEVITIDQGYVFAVFRAPVGASEVRNAFSVNTTTGVATNISNNTTHYGVEHMSSSGNKAAWAFDDGTGSTKLQYYNGSTTATIDNNIFGDPVIAQGRIVYAKFVAPSRAEIFLYDTNLISPSPVQLTNDAAKTNESPSTDGRHAAWIRRNADGTGPEIVLNGQVQVTNGNFTLLDNPADPPFALDRGQIAWRDTSGAIHHLTSFSEAIVDPSTSASRAIPWFADGNLVFYDPTAAPVPIYLYSGEAPRSAQDLSAPMTLQAAASGTSVTLKWDAILGATSYNVYYAAQPGVMRDEYLFLTHGTRITGITGTSQTISGLTPNSPYYFVVTAVDGSGEGAESREASAVIMTTPSWVSVGSLTGTEIAAVTGDRSIPNTVYAAGGNSPTFSTYISTDTGATWTALGGGIAGQNVRALSARDGRVFAMTRPGTILRSSDSGGTWTTSASGTSGALLQSVAIDPAEPDTIVAGDITLSTFTGSANDSNVIRSDDGGSTWFHTPQAPAGGSLVTYCLAFDPQHSSTLFVSGNGTPNVAKSTAGAAGWSDSTPAGGYVYSVAVDPRNSKIVYAAIGQSFGTDTRGVWKSVDGGTTWAQTGLTAVPARVIIVDPADSNVLHAATESGYYFSTNGGTTWTQLNTGLGNTNSQFIQTLTMAGNHRLIAGTYDGLYLLDLASLFAEIPTPANIVAAATGTAQVTINWDSVTQATTYDVFRKDSANGYAKIATVSGSPLPHQYVDNAAAADHSYLYRIVAANGAARSRGSAPDVATTILFDNDPLSPGSSVIKYLHLDELRRGTNAMRVLAGLATITFTSGGAAGSPIKAAQFNEVRTALDPALNGLHLSAGSYTDVLGPGTPIRAVHVQEIRVRMK